MAAAACTARRSCGCAARATTRSARRWRPARSCGRTCAVRWDGRSASSGGSGCARATSTAPRRPSWPRIASAGSLSRVSRWCLWREATFAAAAAAIRDALERPSRVPSKELPPDTDLQRAPLLDAQVEIEIAGGDLDRARAAADELERVAARFQSKALVAGATLARGRVRLAEGDAADAERRARRPHGSGTRSGRPTRRRSRDGPCRGAPRRQRGARRSRAASGPDDPRPDRSRASGATTETNVFRREGDYWSVVFEGRTVRVRDLKGMRYLAQLLAHPGREFHVLDLVGAETGQRMALRGRGRGPRRAGQDRLPPPPCRDRRRHRAGARPRGRRAGSASRRRARLPGSGAGPRGRPGRSRPAGGIRLRARAIRCHARVRQAIARIGEHHPQLGEHLDAPFAPARTAPTSRSDAPEAWLVSP